MGGASSPRGGAWAGPPLPLRHLSSETREQHLPLKGRNTKRWALSPGSTWRRQVGGALPTAVSGRALFAGRAGQLKLQRGPLGPSCPGNVVGCHATQEAPWPAHAPTPVPGASNPHATGVSARFKLGPRAQLCVNPWSAGDRLVSAPVPLPFPSRAPPPLSPLPRVSGLGAVSRGRAPCVLALRVHLVESVSVCRRET